MAEQNTANKLDADDAAKCLSPAPTSTVEKTNADDADAQIIARLCEDLKLEPHPEGGFFAETYKSEIEVTAPWGGGVIRAASTAIHFLITPGSVSRLHRLQADEVWHFYGGGPMTVVELVGDGACTTVLGPLGMGPYVQQHVVKAGTWFGSFPNPGSSFSLVGCTVAPGFEFDDFELASHAKLVEEFPKAETLISKLTVGLP